MGKNRYFEFGAQLHLQTNEKFNFLKIFWDERKLSAALSTQT